MKLPPSKSGREKLLGVAASTPLPRPPSASDRVPYDVQALPEDCPVRPLGMLDSKTPAAVYLSASGVIIELSGQAHGQGNLEMLFAPKNDYLYAHWPRINTKDKIDGFKAEMVRAALTKAAGDRGIWSELDRVRGSGAWRGDDGGLILHLGDRVMIRDGVHKWGEIDGYVYPAAAQRQGPHHHQQPDGAAGPAQQLLTLLETWNWKHPIGARLALGWICAAMLSGALKWRPAIWPTGDRGTGKTTLIDLIKGLFGPGGAISTANTTAAGIRQALMNRSLPVLLDELEAQDDGGDMVQKVIELLRQASSGAIGLRGGADHKGTMFTIRSSMMATSIMVPPLRSQDRSRIAVLELLPLRAGGRPPALSTEQLQDLGQRLLRRMADQWRNLPDRLETWCAELGAHLNMDARGQDQFGTLLACADLALHDAAPDPDSLADLVSVQLRPMLDAARDDDVPDWRRCLDHVLTHACERYLNGERPPLGDLAARAAGYTPGGDEDTPARALVSYGLGLHLVNGVQHLAVANQHKELSKVFQGTIWAGRSGTSGGWRQTLLRMPGAHPSRNAVFFGGWRTRAAMIPLDLALGRQV